MGLRSKTDHARSFRDMELRNLIERVKRHEGFRPRVYDDATGRELRRGDVLRGTPTIGYGTTVVTEQEAEFVLTSTLLRLYSAILNKYPWAETLPDSMLEVLVEMGYQLGFAGLGKFRRFLIALEQREYGAAADEMLDSHWHRQTPTRVEELAEIVRQG